MIWSIRRDCSTNDEKPSERLLDDCESREQNQDGAQEIFLQIDPYVRLQRTNTRKLHISLHLVSVWGYLALLQLSAYSWLSLFVTFTSNVLLFSDAGRRERKREHTAGGDNLARSQHQSVGDWDGIKA